MIAIGYAICWVASLSATILLVASGHEYFAIAILFMTCGLTISSKRKIFR